MHVVRSISVADGMTLSACLPLPNNKTVLLGSKVCSNFHTELVVSISLNDCSK